MDKIEHGTQLRMEHSKPEAQVVAVAGGIGGGNVVRGGVGKREMQMISLES